MARTHVCMWESRGEPHISVNLHISPPGSDRKEIYLTVDTYTWDDAKHGILSSESVCFSLDSEKSMDRLVSQLEIACAMWRERKRTGPNGEEENQAAPYVACGC